MKHRISISQALLILIEKYQNNCNKYEELKKLYFFGVQNEKDEIYLQELLQDSSLQNYIVSADPETINEEPTRRYFETHLAFETLRDLLNEIDINEFIELFEKIFIGIKLRLSKSEMHHVNHVLKGQLTDHEYSGAIHAVENNKSYGDFTLIQKDMIKLTIGIGYLSVRLVNLIPMPLNIYQQGFFSAIQRGRVEKDDQDQVKSNNLGIVKSYMPIPSDDIAFSEVESFDLRSTDKCQIKNTEAQWVSHNAKLKIHPFVNSISGSMLCLLKVLKYLNDKEKFSFAGHEKLGRFFKFYCSILLYQLGGHTFYEFLAVLNIPEVQAAFKFIDGFNQLGIALLFEKNEHAFTRALDDTIQYQKNYLLKKNVNADVIRAKLKSV